MSVNKENVFITGERLNFQPINLENLSSMKNGEMTKKSEIIGDIFFLDPTEEIKQRYTDSITAFTKYSFEIHHKLDRIPIGTCNLHEIHWINRTAEIGFFIGEKHYWGKGFGTEVVKMLMNYAFQTLNLRKLRAIVYSPNLGSKKIFEKLGFVLEATLKNEEFIESDYIDILYYTAYK